MSKIKLSPCFSESKEDKPVNVGVYKTVLYSNNCAVGGKRFSGWSRWNGKRWGDTCQTIAMAEHDKALGAQEKRWQGILK